MTSPEFTPEEHNPLSASRGVEHYMSHSDQLHLVRAIQQAAEKLQNAPSVKPARTATRLSGITLPPSSDTFYEHMSLSFSTEPDRFDAASIGFTSGRYSVQYDLSDVTNLWEERRAGTEKPVRYLEHGALIGILSQQLGQDQIFKELMDTCNFTGINIAQILARHLKNSAKNQTQASRYVADGVIFRKNDFDETRVFLLDQIDADWHTQQLSVVSLLHVGRHLIERTSTYEVKVSKQAIGAAGGEVVISSSSNDIPKDGFRALAQALHDGSGPADDFRYGLQLLGEQYGISLSEDGFNPPDTGTA